MPILQIAAKEYEIYRNAVVVDTNVLYSAFGSGDSRTDDVRAFFQLSYQFLVPVAVIVETWGLLVGRDKYWDGGFDLLNWLIDPSSGVQVIDVAGEVANIHALARELHVDCVDAVILHLAERVTLECNFKPGCQIATYDTRDFLNVLRKRPFSATLLDLETGDETELDF